MATKIRMTQEGYEAEKRKLSELKQAQNDNIIALQDARGQGDLSENADYDAARNRQAELAALIKECEYNIKNAEIIHESDDTNMGKFVKVRFLDDGFEETYHIVGTTQADPLAQSISIESPLGKAILTATKGQVVLVKTEEGDSFDVKVLDIKAAEQKKAKKK